MCRTTVFSAAALLAARRLGAEANAMPNCTNQTECEWDEDGYYYDDGFYAANYSAVEAGTAGDAGVSAFYAASTKLAASHDAAWQVVLTRAALLVPVFCVLLQLSCTAVSLLWPSVLGDTPGTSANRYKRWVNGSRVVSALVHAPVVVVLGVHALWSQYAAAGAMQYDLPNDDPVHAWAAGWAMSTSLAYMAYDLLRMHLSARL